MMTDSYRMLQVYFTRGRTLVEALFQSRDRDEIDRLVCQALKWRRGVIQAGFNHNPDALHFYVVDPKQHEVARFAPFWDVLTPDQRGCCHYMEAVLSRLSEYFLLRPDTRPKRPGGNRSRNDYGPIIEAARAFMKRNNIENKSLAVREVSGDFHEFFRGKAKVTNVIKRIVSKM